jgi:hypothetical protein
MDNLPVLNLEEKAWIEKQVGRGPLTNEEAQLYLHQARLLPGPYEQWLLNRQKAVA